MLIPMARRRGLARFLVAGLAVLALLSAGCGGGGGGGGTKTDRVVNVGEFQCRVKSRAASGSDCMTSEWAIYVDLVVASAGLRVAPVPTPDRVTRYQMFPVADTHKQVTVRTSSGSAYQIEVPAHLSVKIGDAWPPSATPEPRR